MKNMSKSLKWLIGAVVVGALVAIGLIASPTAIPVDVLEPIATSSETQTVIQDTPTPKTTTIKQEPTPVVATLQKTITTTEDLFASQKEVVQALSEDVVGDYSPYVSNAESRYMDLMAPLGVLDPYASENNPVKDDSALINVLFGYYGAHFGFSDDHILDMANRPLVYAMEDFDEEDYFAQNESKLERIRTLINAQPSIKVLAYWTSGIGRVNETFNAEVGFWKQDKISGAYYDLSDIQFAKTIADADKVYKSSSIANVDPEKTIEIVNQMRAINVTVVYKCSERMIFIMGATSDNASGFIYGDGDVNCGYLGNRFGVIKETKLNDEWRFWVAN